MIKKVKQAGKISLSYSPLGLRQSKKNSTSKEWYIHDATGNIMCIYDSLSSNSIICKERPLYGSSRLGIDNKEITIKSGNWGTLPDTNRFRGYCGYRNFELSNHLGNVLTTFSDRKWGMDDNSDGIVDYYKPVVTSWTDYYPFGYPMPERNWSGTYRFGFNGQEKDNEIYGEEKNYSFEFRKYDARLGRFWSVDPLTKDYPWNSPYAFAENDVIRAIDIEGLEKWINNQSQLVYGPYSLEYVDQNKMKSLQSVLQSDRLVEAVENAQTSTTFKTLQTKANLINIQVTNQNAGTWTDNAIGNINIDNRGNLNEMILGMAWEMTNSSNSRNFNNINNQAKEGKISKKDYVMGKLKLETEAFLNSALIASELNIDDPMTNQFKTEIEAVKNGTMTKDDLLNNITQYGYNTAQSKLPDGSSAKVSDIYGQQYDNLRSENQQKDQKNGAK